MQFKSLPSPLRGYIALVTLAGALTLAGTGATAGNLNPPLLAFLVLVSVVFSTWRVSAATPPGTSATPMAGPSSPNSMVVIRRG